MMKSAHKQSSWIQLARHQWPTNHVTAIWFNQIHASCFSQASSCTLVNFTHRTLRFRFELVTHESSHFKTKEKKNKALEQKVIGQTWNHFKPSGIHPQKKSTGFQSMEMALNLRVSKKCLAWAHPANFNLSLSLSGANKTALTHGILRR